MPVQFSIQDVRITKINYLFLPEKLLSTPAAEQNTSETDKQEIHVRFNFRTEQVVMKGAQHLLKIYQSVDLTGSPDIPYSLVLEVGGIFALDSLPPPEELSRLQHINCNAILFPYLREAVSEITRRGGQAPVYLQPLNFLQMYQEGVFKPDRNAAKS